MVQKLGSGQITTEEYDAAFTERAGAFAFNMAFMAVAAGAGRGRASVIGEGAAEAAARRSPLRGTLGRIGERIGELRGRVKEALDDYAVHTEENVRQAIKNGRKNELGILGEIPSEEQLNTVSKQRYEYLRRKSPSREIQQMVNKVDGPKVDPVYGYEVTTLAADHLVSLKRITEMEGFGRLTLKHQLEVANLPENFIGLGKSTNSSKGAKSFADWPGHSELGPVDPAVRSHLIGLENKAFEALRTAIDERLRVQEQ